LHMTNAIPLSPHGVDNEKILYMLPGDSIQFLYYFELVRDWITGNTPFFYNLYEFNTGNDAERYLPGGYYVPFSLIYAFSSILFGPAFGVNFTGLISLWITMLSTWLLLRRYVSNEWIVWIFSIFVLFLPFRWKMLFDGSPSGLAMMWVPVLILGLDLAVRDGKIRGGVIAAIALVMSYFGDLHVFFFSVLVTPAWCILALIATPLPVSSWHKHFFSVARSFIPLALSAVIVFLLVQNESAFLQETHMAEGRSVGEVRMSSPTKNGFFHWQGGNIASQVYVGWAISGVIFFGGFAILWDFIRRPREQLRPTIFFVLLIFGSLFAAILALGPNGLRTGGLYMLVRELIPPYTMIRQAGKIYCLMPTLLAVAGAIALASLIRMGTGSKSWLRNVGAVLIAIIIYWDYSRLNAMELVYLQPEQPAYGAVVEDARKRGLEPRALVVPLWHGDSHFASVYQYFSMMYRVRMINGYTPAISQVYFDDVFLAYESINQGYLSTTQVESLLNRGVRYLLLHEDLYPEKVAPFPVTFAISQYLDHPRLEFMKRADSVWAFRILDSPSGCVQQDFDWGRFQERPFFPARHWEMERSRHENALVFEDHTASGARYVTLQQDDAVARLSWTGVPPAPGLRWMVRGRGQGVLHADFFLGDELFKRMDLDVDHAQWAWLELPLQLETFSKLSLQLTHAEGSVDLDSALITAGQWPLLHPGESMVVPAASFFHAGYSEPSQEQVVFQKKFYAQRVVFYGPRMPMAPGTYEITIAFSADAEKGAELGALHMPGGNAAHGTRMVPLNQGQEARFQIDIDDNLPFNMDLFFSGEANVTLDNVRFLRIK